MKRILLVFMMLCFLLSVNTQSIADSERFTRQQFYNEFYLFQKEFKWLNFETFKIVKLASYKYKVPGSFICSVFQYETGDYCKNNWNKMLKVRGSSGEIGPGQIIAKFHLKQGETEKMLYEPKFHINKVASILSDYRVKAKYNWRKTLKNYNSGPVSNFYNEKYITRILTKFNKIKKILKNNEV
jgi:hypothetical protein